MDTARRELEGGKESQHSGTGPISAFDLSHLSQENNWRRQGSGEDTMRRKDTRKNPREMILEISQSFH